MGRRVVIVMLYVLYGLVLTAVLLVLLFPKERFLDWIADRLEQALPGFVCRVEEVRYVHPFALRLSGMVLDNEPDRLSIPIDTMLVRFKPRWPLEPLAVSATLYGGVAEADIAADFPENQFELNRLSVSSVRLNDIDFLHTRLDRRFAGELSLLGEMVVSPSHFKNMQFNGSLTIDNFATKLRRPILQVIDINFNQILADVTLDGGIINVSAGHYRGELISGNFSGWIAIENPWSDSRFEIDGGVIPHAELLERSPYITEAAAELYRKYREEAIPCQIEGTLENPQFRFGRKDESAVQRAQ